MPTPGIPSSSLRMTHDVIVILLYCYLVILSKTCATFLMENMFSKVFIKFKFYGVYMGSPKVCGLI
jgi:hypothetical protein